MFTFGQKENINKIKNIKNIRLDNKYQQYQHSFTDKGYAYLTTRFKAQ